jgi:chromosome partitioning protein
MRTIAVVNQKGGCGKTITSINLSAFLAEAGRRTLLVDMDPQAHSTLGLSVGQPPPSRSMYDVFRAALGGPEMTLPDITRPVGENFDLAPSDILLSAIPDTLAGSPGRENILGQAFGGLDARYDYIIVDCPPNVGLLTFNALKACTEALVPMDPSFFSLHGIGKLFETFQILEQQTGHHISPRVLITLYSGRSPFVKAVVEEVHQHLGGEHFTTVVRQSVKLAEAASHGVPITQYAPHSVGYQDYQALAQEILAQEVRAQEPAPVAEEAVGAEPAPAIAPVDVVFTLEAPEAARVQLAADFNGWTPEGNEMEAVGQTWKKLVRLAPGRYRYRYVIDGEWRRDPGNALAEASPFGGEDSVLVVESPVPAQSSAAGIDDGTA